MIEEEKKSDMLVGAAETSKGRRLQLKNLSILSLLKKTVASVPQIEQLANTPKPPLPKGTEPSVQSTRS